MQALELLWFLATLNGTKNIPLEYPVRVSPEARGRAPGFLESWFMATTSSF